MIYNKLRKKTVLVLIFSLVSCIIFTSNVYAGSTIDEMISDADEFLQIGADDAILTGPGSPLDVTSEYIYNILLIIAVAVAVLVGTYLGIKFMLESAEDKAKIKEAMIPFVVGCFVIFGAFGIWKIMVNVGNSISGNQAYHSGIFNGIVRVAGDEKYYEWVETEYGGNVEKALSFLRNTDFSKLNDTEKEKYKEIVQAAIKTYETAEDDTILITINHVYEKYFKSEPTPEPTPTPEPIQCKAKNCDKMASKYNDKGFCTTHYEIYKSANGE